MQEKNNERQSTYVRTKAQNLVVPSFAVGQREIQRQSVHPQFLEGQLFQGRRWDVVLLAPSPHVGAEVVQPVIERA